MNELHDIGNQILGALDRLDKDEYQSREEFDEIVEFLREEFSPRESMLILHADTLKESFGASAADSKRRFEINSYVRDVIEKIAESGYLGTSAKHKFKKPKDPTAIHARQSKIRAKIDATLGNPTFRFAFSKDYSCIKDVHHNKDTHYKIAPYEGLNRSSVFVEVFKALLAGALDSKSQGWVHTDKRWRGAFQKMPYRRFRDEQIYRGSMKKGHNGYWRFYTDGEFDELSSAGKFIKRKRPND